MMSYYLHFLFVPVFLVFLPWDRAVGKADKLESHFIESDPNLTMQKLRTYCAACHGVGELRFIYTEDDKELWDYIHKNNAPNSKKIWAKGIVEVLDWPSDTAPPFGQMLEPPNRDWMPRGSKRLSLAKEVLNGVPVRKIMLQTLQESVD